jgi:AcrR family transcriptional regulator
MPAAETNPAGEGDRPSGLAQVEDRGRAGVHRAAPDIAPAKSAPYRRAQHDRGAETRARLVEAALDVFGRLGFEGATTRQIAKEAGANLAAIVYHFGSKEALHRAVAEHIVASVRARIGTVLAASANPAAAATPDVARATLARLLENFVEVILGSAEAERWARFIVREQLQPTASFDVIYGFMGPAHGIATHLVAVATGRSENDEEVRLRVFTFMGQVMVFRVAQALVLRRMGWDGIGARERTRIKEIIVAQIGAILDHEVRS